MTAPTAETRVLETPEIIESILLQLPIRDLLVTAQRINQAWRNLILSSPAIQDKLFFSVQARKSNSERFVNPLLQASFPHWFKEDSDDNNSPWSMGITFDDLDWNTSDAKREAYAREEASWRKMLPIQPALKQLEVVKRSHAMGGSDECIGEAYFKDGVRMGTLYDLAQVEANRSITRVGVKWVQEETKGLLGGLARSLGVGKEINKVVIIIDWTVQCCYGRPGPVKPEFKSLGFEEVKIKWGQTKDMPFR